MLALAALPGCALVDGLGMGSEARKESRRQAEQKAQAEAEHALFRQMPNWKRNSYTNKALLEKARPNSTAIKISLSEQRGFLLVEDALAMDFPVATGKRSHPTPSGHYTILDKKKAYASNLYGKITDAEGTVLNKDADVRTDAVPEGGSFVGASMPYWMRLTNSGVGLHVGYVPGRPASHGCIRLRKESAQKLFELTKIGTPVVIE